MDQNRDYIRAIHLNIIAPLGGQKQDLAHKTGEIKCAYLYDVITP